VLSRQKNTRVWLGTVVDVDPDLTASDFNFTKTLSEVRAAREIKPESASVPH
jgi:hypothetical protein